MASCSSNGQLKLTAKEHIELLVALQEKYESPPEEDVRNVTAQDDSGEELKRVQHIIEFTRLTVHCIVLFAQRVPGFESLCLNDKIALLKVCSGELLMLRAARKYDLKTDSIVFANDQLYTREDFHNFCMGDFADAIFNFCRFLYILKVDNGAYALLTAIVIFSERPGLLNPREVEKIKEGYIEILRCYVAVTRPQDPNYLAKLLSTQVELRTLGIMNLEYFELLKANYNDLPPLLEELWDFQMGD